MKALGIVGVAMGALAIALGLYLQFVLVPAADDAEVNWDLAISMGQDNYFGSIQHAADMDAIDAKVDFGAIVMGGGLLAFLLSVLPAIRKNHVAWIGVGTGLITFFMGAAYGTHMFS